MIPCNIIHAQCCIAPQECLFLLDARRDPSSCVSAAGRFPGLAACFALALGATLGVALFLASALGALTGFRSVLSLCDLMFFQNNRYKTL